MNNKEKIFSLHRYTDESGASDCERIFSEGESRFWIERHLDPDLKKIWKNQPDVVQKEVAKHLLRCEDCKTEFIGAENENSGQKDLPF